ncbi:methyltransferase domain-containing protein [Nonomuraea sp. B1E8]|uniref:methyltransferase domain-containing protein n=1 Tax=unclassified Nonomuraea TaxID=2593643 RepID=UPI00325E1237
MSIITRVAEPRITSLCQINLPREPFIDNVWRRDEKGGRHEAHQWLGLINGPGSIRPDDRSTRAFFSSSPMLDIRFWRGDIPRVVSRSVMVHMMNKERAKGPRVGDAIGEVLRAGQKGLRDGTIATIHEVMERDDGLVLSAPIAPWFASVDQWPERDRPLLDMVAGRVLDIGAGAGRAARALTDRGLDVVPIDISPGAVEVCKTQGFASAMCTTVYEHAATTRARYDTFLLFGGNLGLLESRENAPRFLTALATMAAPGARVVGQGRNLTASNDPLHLAYNEDNLRRGRVAGQRTLRIRYRDLATPWFEYLCCAPEELATFAAEAGWELVDVVPTDNSVFFATLELQGR